jgi:hypothetical protein
MQAIREIKRVSGQKITIALPKSFSGTEVEIIILPAKPKRPLATDKIEALLLSESALKKDWNRREEEEAWKNL